MCTFQNHSANENENSLVDNGLFLSQKLSDISAIKGFKIVHQHISGLTGRIDELRLIVSELRSSLQFMSFSETWAHKDIADSELGIPGYKLFRRDRGNKGGGLAVYVRNDMKVMRCPDIEESTIEGLWVEVCPPKSRSFIVGTFYKPPTSSNHAVKDFMPIFGNCLRRATAMDREVIITGDLNCNLLPKRTTESDCKQLKALLRQENLT